MRGRGCSVEWVRPRRCRCSLLLLLTLYGVILLFAEPSYDVLRARHRSRSFLCGREGVCGWVSWLAVRPAGASASDRQSWPDSAPFIRAVFGASASASGVVALGFVGPGCT